MHFLTMIFLALLLLFSCCRNIWTWKQAKDSLQHCSIALGSIMPCYKTIAWLLTSQHRFSVSLAIPCHSLSKTSASTQS